jgi:hypothetical protein
MSRTLFGSLTRIADLGEREFEVRPLDRRHWQTGDYVVGVVTGKATRLYQVETRDGSMWPAKAGDRVVGVFGERAATLEGVGSYREIRDDGRMQAMTSAGLFGRITSLSPLLPSTMDLDYAGHAIRGGKKITMREFAIRTDARGFSTPTILLVGTSMSAGKTVTGKLICRLLYEDGRRTIGSKLTGAGRYRDILAFRKAGAEQVFDFVDAGLPSTFVPDDEFRAAVRPLLAHIHAQDADLLVAEAGASPLEPYNGEAAIDELGDNICLTVLCASDPYAVVGVMQAFSLEPDVVTGPATNTTAAIDLVHRLTGLPAISILDRGGVDEFRRFLFDRLDRPSVH